MIVFKKISQPLKRSKKLLLEPRWRFLIGLLTFPTVFLLQNDSRSFASLAAILLASRIVGYRLWWKKVLLFSSTLMFFYLLSPRGLTLWELSLPWGQTFRITAESLYQGLLKVSLMLQLILLSGFSISQNFQFKNKWNRKLGKVFFLYQQMLRKSEQLSFRQPIRSLDALLLDLNEETSATQIATADRSSVELEESEQLSWLFYLIILPLPNWLHWLQTI